MLFSITAKMPRFVLLAVYALLLSPVLGDTQETQEGTTEFKVTLMLFVNLVRRLRLLRL